MDFLFGSTVRFMHSGCQIMMLGYYNPLHRLVSERIYVFTTVCVLFLVKHQTLRTLFRYDTC